MLPLCQESSKKSTSLLVVAGTFLALAVTGVTLAVVLPSRENPAAFCGEGTTFVEDEKKCVKMGPRDPLVDVKGILDCDRNDLECFCDTHGYGTRGPSLAPHTDCTK